MNSELDGKIDSHQFDDKLMYVGPAMELPTMITAPGFTSIQEGEFISIMDLLCTYLMSAKMSRGNGDDEKVRFAKAFMLLTPENRQKVLTKVCHGFENDSNKKEIIRKTGLFDNLTPLTESDIVRFEKRSIFQIMLTSFIQQDFPLKEVLKEDPDFLKNIKYPNLKKLMPQIEDKKEMENFLYNCGLRGGFFEMVDFLFFNDEKIRDKAKKEYIGLKNPIIESLFNNISELGGRLSNIEISDLYVEWESEKKYELLLEIFKKEFEKEGYSNRSSRLTGLMNILVSNCENSNDLYNKFGKGFFSKSYYKKIESEEDEIIRFEISPMKILKVAAFSKNRDHIIDYFKKVEGHDMLWSDELIKITWKIDDITTDIKEIEKDIKEINGYFNISYHDKINLERLMKSHLIKSGEKNGLFTLVGEYLFPSGTKEMLFKLKKEGVDIEIYNEEKEIEKYPVIKLDIPREMESVIENFLSNACFLDKGQLAESFATTVNDYAMRKLLNDNKVMGSVRISKRKF